MNDRLIDFASREKAAKRKIRMMDQMNEARVRGWWEAMDHFNAEEITRSKEWLNTIVVLLNVQLKQLKKGVSSSAQSPLEDASN